MLQLESKGPLGAEFKSKEDLGFFLLRSSTVWTGPTHTMEALLRVCPFKCKSHPRNTCTATSRLMFDQKLDYTIA